MSAAHYSLSQVESGPILELFDRRMRRDDSARTACAPAAGGTACCGPRATSTARSRGCRRAPAIAAGRRRARPRGGGDRARGGRRLDPADGRRRGDGHRRLSRPRRAVPRQPLRSAARLRRGRRGRRRGRGFRRTRRPRARQGLRRPLRRCTLPAFRGRGLYRATVAERARIASTAIAGLYVDALPTSRPILERLGFVRLTTTTPYVLLQDSRP